MSQSISPKPTRSLPIHHVLAVIDQIQEAEQAVQALQNAGYPTQDILLISGQSFIEVMQQRRRQSSFFKRALHTFLVSSDNGFPADMYLRQARRGSHTLAVYTSTANQAQRIAQILSSYNVHMVKYIGRWTTTDFPF